MYSSVSNTLDVRGTGVPSSRRKSRFAGVELERAEFVDVTGGSLHRGFRTIQKNSAAA